MVSRKLSKKSRTRKIRRHKSSLAGKILPPLNVNSNKSLHELKNRILKGPLTIMLVYADWCGHCHQLMPHWDKAVLSPNRTIQAVKVNDGMLEAVNSTINRTVNHNAKPYSVEGYPTIIMVDKKGNMVTEVQPVKDADALAQVMNKAGPLSKQSEMETQAPSGNNRNVQQAPAGNNRNVNKINSLKKLSVTNSNAALINVKNNLKKVKTNISTNVDIEETPVSMVNEPAEELEGRLQPVSNSSVQLVSNSSVQQVSNSGVQPVSNSSVQPVSNSGVEGEVSEQYAQVPVTSLSEDMEIASRKNIQDPTQMNLQRKISGGSYSSRGGGLYDALLKSSGQLAPAAILLGTAAMVMKNKSRKGKKRKSKKTRKH
jgi:thiol-disulfide isomerase/thioredoxin